MITCRLRVTRPRMSSAMVTPTSIDIAEVGRIVPDKFRAMSQVLIDREPGIVIAITAGKDNNSKSHEF